MNDKLNSIYIDFQNAKRYKEDVDKNISKWRDEYNGEPYGNEIEGKSQIVWKLIKKHGEILIANLSKPLLSGSSIISTKPRTANDVYKAELDEKMLNYFFNREFDKVKFIKTLLNVMVKEGTAIVKVSWEKNTYNNRPYADVLYNEDVFTEPNAVSIEDSNYIIHRFETTFEKLESDKRYNKDSINKFKAIFDKDEFGSINDQAIADDMHDRMTYLTEGGSFKKIYVYEYWVKSKDGIKIISFLNSGAEIEIIAEEKFEYNWFPFIEFQLYLDEFKIWGRSLSDVITDEQKFMTSIVRGVIDNMALSNNGQKFVRKGALDSVNFKNLMEGKSVIEVNSTEALQNVVFDGRFNELPQSVYNLLQIIEGQAEGLTGVSKMMQGLHDISTESATSSQIMMSQSQIRLLDIEENIKSSLTKMFSFWIEMIIDYIEDKQMLQITGTTFIEQKDKLIRKLTKQYQVDKMPKDTQIKAMQLIMKEANDIFDKKTSKYDLKIEIATDGLKQIKINQINMLLQQSGPLIQAGAIPPKVVQQLAAQLFELFDYPDIAKETREFEPQPDPMQQQMMQLQMAELEAKARKEDALAKNALARTEQTMVGTEKDKMSAEADVLNKYADVQKKLAETHEKETNAREKANVNNINEQ